MSQFMLVMSQQFTIAVNKGTKLLQTDLAIDDLENSRELQIFADFIVINW